MTGFAAGNSFPNDTNKLIKTTDGGQNWIRKPGIDSVSFTCIYFTNPSTGYAAGSKGKISKTVNSGESWFTLPTPVTDYIYDIKFFDPQNGIACGYNGVILTTGDGGNNWQQVNTSTQFHYIPFL